MSKLTFVLDVDGVLSTGQFLYDENGKAYKIFGPHDADGLKLIRESVDIFFISADKRGFPISQARVNDMGYNIELVSEGDRHQFVKDRFGFENLIYIGDGIFDAPLIKDAHCGIAPANARQEAKNAADFITPSKAGEGAICDACIYIQQHLLKEGVL